MRMFQWGRSLIRGVMLAALVLTWSAGPAPVALAAQDIQTAPIRLRIGVTADGIVQVGPADLVAAGVDPAAVDPHTFAMSSMGNPVAIQVITVNNNSSFDQGEYVLFFGQKYRGTEFQEKYTDERVYWLDIGGTAGQRIADVPATPQNNLVPPQDVAATVRAEQDVIRATLWTLSLVNITQDTLFWKRLQPTPVQPVTATLDYIVPDPAPGAAAMFRAMEFINYSRPTAQPEHHNVVMLNNKLLLDQTWSGTWPGKEIHQLTATASAGSLVSGANSVQLGAYVMPGNYTDNIYVNYWELDYRRLFRAWQGQFDFRAEAQGLHEYVVGNWTSNLVAIWDISNADQPRNLTGATAEPDGAATAKLRFRTDDAAGARYWLQEQTAFSHPTSLRVQNPTGLRDQVRGADTVIVTPADFLPAAQRLAAWHEAHGRRAVVAVLQDVYDEFNEGNRIAPEAIPNMLRLAAAQWPSPAPTYLVLLGDGHWNMKGIAPEIHGTAPDYVPPYLAFVDPEMGEAPVDMRYGDLDGDGLPDVAVGRLAANSLDDANTIVDKIVSYSETVRSADWQRRALFVADNDDPGAGNFPVLSDEIVNGYLPADLAVTKAYLPGQDPAGPTPEQVIATKKTISDTLQAGVWMVQFTGHGATQYWAKEQLLTVSEVAGLSNDSRLPVIMSFNCFDGLFIDPKASYQALAEVQQRQPGGGAVAVISPTGEGYTTAQQAFRKILMTVMFKENVRELGKALDLAKRRYAAQGGADYLVETMTLFGDPAMQLPAAPHYVYLPAVQR
jgi:hypothetical protein